jgi:filamentous hemagglutinin
LLERSDHFLAHGARLGILTEEEYADFADTFLRNPRPPSAREFMRAKNGDRVRYDEIEDVFAVVTKDRFIKTCYRPDPAFHGEPSNLDYYLREEANR